MMFWQKFAMCMASIACTTNVGSQMEEKSMEKCPQLTGQIVTPNDENYAKARLVSNFYTSKESFPALIVYCQTTSDVQNAVKWARCKNLSIRVRSGGHNHEGFSTGTGVVVIDVSKMKQVQIDRSHHQATVQPGITGGELYHRLYQEGYTQVGGTCADVGISGLVLTGGMGPLLRREGLACDNLLSLEMVNAKGEVLVATKNNEHQDLFWACCGGGGGNFGVVTSLVLKIHPAKQVTWFNIGWDWNQPVEKIIAAWQDFFLKEDKRWFSHLDLRAKPFPAEKFKKQPIKIMGVFYGAPEEAKRELAPLINIGTPSDQTIASVNWDRSIQLFEEATATFITDKPEYKSSGAFAMQPLPAEAIKIIVETLRNSNSQLLNVLVFTLGGAARDKSSSDSAYYYRQASSFYQYSTQWLQGNEADKQLKEVDLLRQRLLPYTVGDYVGNPDRTLKDYLTDYYGDNVAKLRCIKSQYDPDNIFRFEQSLPLAGTPSCK